MITIRDIAKEANVSTATVSRVINNQDSVKDSKRKQVQEVIDRLNYSPNALARGLVTNSTNTIAIMIPEIINTYNMTLTNSFVKELEKNKYNVVFLITHADTEKEKEYIELMRNKRVDGLVFLESRILNSPNNELLLNMSKQLPVLLLDYIDFEEFNYIVTDFYTGAYKATEYLIKLGHRNIAFLNGDDRYTAFNYKRKGFEAAMRDYDLEIKSQYYKTVDMNVIGGYTATMAVLHLNERPTAIFATGDQIVVGIYSAIQEFGLRIPDDISVIGFSGAIISQGLFPKMTIMCQYPVEIGIEAAKTILSIIENNGSEVKHLVYEPKLIERNSCKSLEINE
ncbi:MAG: LacI family DNA-binding transcriptional regulator [Christensenellales bacterium]